MSRKTPDNAIEIDIDLDELDITSAEAKASYTEIKEYIWENYGLKIPSAYIAQVKRKLGMEVRENYNLSKQESPRRSHCTPEKEEAILAALKHFGMLADG